MKKPMAVILLAACIAMAGCSFQPSSAETEMQSTAAGTEAGAQSTAEGVSAEGSAVEETASEPEIDPETMSLIKYNIYVEMNNYMVEVLDNLDNYYMVVEYADDFALIPDSGYDYKFGISYLNTDILEDAVAVASMEPAYDSLDELTKEIAEPMRALMEGFNQISDSYDFADNQYAKAKEFHTQIQENVDVFDALSYEFMEKLDVIGNERVAANEQKMLEDGNLIIYSCSHAITLADQILDECYAQGIDDSNITELDLTNIKVLYEELTATVAAYHDAVNDSEQIMKESLSNSAPFDGLLDSLAQSVEWMINQVESGQPIEDPGREFLGGTVHIHAVLSQCIDRYNDVFAS